MCTHLPVVLPSADELERIGRGFPGDEPVHVTPESGVHGVEIASGGIFPAADPLRCGSVGRVSLEVLGSRVVIRVSGHMLADAIDEELVDCELFWSASLPQGRGDLFPFQKQFISSADDDGVGIAGLEGDGKVFGSRVLRL